MSNASFRVPFPLAGEGLFLYFNISDIETLETNYGAGEVFGMAEEFLLNKPSATHTLSFLTLGLKYDDGSGKALSAFPEKVEGAPDDLNFSIVAAAEPIMNAISLSVYGKDHKTLVEDALERQKSLQKEIEGQQKKPEGEDPFLGSEE